MVTALYAITCSDVVEIMALIEPLGGSIPLSASYFLQANREKEGATY